MPHIFLFFLVAVVVFADIFSNWIFSYFCIGVCVFLFPLFLVKTLSDIIYFSFILVFHSEQFFYSSSLYNYGRLEENGKLFVLIIFMVLLKFCYSFAFTEQAGLKNSVFMCVKLNLFKFPELLYVHYRIQIQWISRKKIYYKSTF